MPEAIEPNTTPEQFFWQGYQRAQAAIATEPETVAETKRAELIKDVARLSREVWSKPAPSRDDLALLAELAAYWNGGGYDEDGDFFIDGLDSAKCDRRAVAELIDEEIPILDLFANAERDNCFFHRCCSLRPCKPYLSVIECDCQRLC